MSHGDINTGAPWGLRLSHIDKSCSKSQLNTTKIVRVVKTLMDFLFLLEDIENILEKSVARMKMKMTITESDTTENKEIYKQAGKFCLPACPGAPPRCGNFGVARLSGGRAPATDFRPQASCCAHVARLSALSSRSGIPRSPQLQIFWRVLDQASEA